MKCGYIPAVEQKKPLTKLLKLGKQIKERHHATLSEQEVHPSLSPFPQWNGLLQKAMGARGKSNSSLSQIVTIRKIDKSLAC